ncbi:Uncharacterized conserved protein YdhG, YjbR/CyaY-like superfamily, DUF1801 family [Fodinibius roseus]|uniref:Uncharacterized conserved protein YdhG, YjbR/CyaY-like superfamily, DUF1801 family n=1 Tax=Fodinibius roseus TaxID=1194090 RepID=A0A1M5ISA8_9BACT|nr:DUF1801 domain-containing protein [Fodinibius roseus]SHG31232.1 Uncharacterized conserved protein YdhG, YjbR/CyaY-like superfamily, DUF1801 family [Fodinibius roseus]
MTKPKDVDSYIANAPSRAHPILKELREIITSTIPEAEEGISYNVPFYKFHGVHVGFSAFKNHATFGIGADVLHSKNHKMLEEKGYKTGKETIQIKYGQKVPATIIKQLLKAKMNKAKRTTN